jgi:hypothetical protein
MKQTARLVALSTTILATSCGAYDSTATADESANQSLIIQNNDEPQNGVLLEKVGANGVACTLVSIANGTWYSQRSEPWQSHWLGNSSSVDIYHAGCVISCLAMVYNDVWATSTNPDNMNSSAKAAGCFGSGSPDVVVPCAINSRGGPHNVTAIPMSSVATAICAGYPVMVDTTWGGGHKLLVYSYNGGGTTSMSSYTAVDPWYGTSKSLSSFTALQWRKFY